MWNELNLKCPNDYCHYHQSEDGLILSKLPDLVGLLITTAEIVSEDNPIWTEIKVFNNVKTNYKRILHCDKPLLLLQRVGSCLKKMVVLNLSKSYLDLINNFSSGQDSLYMPSRQSLEFVLIRTQSAAKLISEALHYSKEAFCYLLQRISVGHLILNLMMSISVTARINIIMKGMLVQLFDSYRKLYQYRGKLKLGSFEWPQTLDLPEDLELWLKPEETEPLKAMNLPQDKVDLLTSFFENKGIENTQSDLESLMVHNVNDIQCTYEEDMETSIDLGEAISRNMNQHIPIESIPDEPKLKLTRLQKLLLDKINKTQSLKKLRIIWSNLNTDSTDLLPKKLTPERIRKIQDMFTEMKSRIIHIKTMNLSMAKKENKRKTILEAAISKFAEHLGLVSLRISGNLNPVKTFKKLNSMYLTLHNALQSDQQYDKCHKLKKMFKSKKADVRLLIENNEKAIAKKLIFNTSKVFLAKFQI